ncbi:hypothetical protein HY495_00615 [Candidatus Woesearchaeota archaeon]|nr:hypothetical protein [Candidatus Woesearchaeota archaeon]
MELTSQITQEWNDRYRVHEIRFFPKTGFPERSDRFQADRFQVVSQPVGNVGDEQQGRTRGDQRSMVEVPYHSAMVQFHDGIEPLLIIHRRIRKGRETSVSGLRDYQREEVVRSEFELPTGYRIIGLEDIAE